MEAKIRVGNRIIECTYREGAYFTREKVEPEEFRSQKVEIESGREVMVIKRARAEITRNNGVYRIELRERTEEEKRADYARKGIKRQNEWISENYDRISITLPKGTKERIKELGYSVNGLVNEAVKVFLEAQE